MVKNEKNHNVGSDGNLIKLGRSIFIVDITEKDCLEVIDDISEDQFPNLILLIKKNSHRYKYIDIGSYCFESKKRRNRTEVETKVDIKSINYSRIKGLKKFILSTIDRHKSNTSLIADLMNLGHVIEYFNENFKKSNFEDINTCKYMYIEFTKFLINRINVGIANARGYQLQHSCALFLSHTCEISIFELEKIATKIMDSDINRPFYNNGREDEISTYISKNIILFETISKKLMNNEDLPFVVNFEKIDDFLIFDTSLNSTLDNKDKYKILFDKNNNLKSLDLIGEIIKSKNKNQILTGNSLYNAGRRKWQFIKKINNEKLSDSKFKLRLASIAIFAFSQAFVAATSCNSSVLIKLRDEGNILTSQEKGRRIYAVKARAKYKEQSISFGLKFQKYFKSYLNFIKFLKHELNQYFDKETQNKLFFVIVQTDEVKVHPFDDVYIYEYYKIISRIYGSRHIVNSELRNNVGNFFASNTNDSNLVASKLGNSTKIAIKNYIDVSFEVMAEEVSNFFNKVQEKAIYKGRIDTNSIAVNINEKEVAKNSIGYCKNVKPSLKQGFNSESITPNCANSESCLFCENYTIFTDESDLRRLLSFKMIISQLNKTDDQLIQINYRIDEIINLIVSKYPDTEKMISNLISETEEGVLDEFWNHHLNMLVDLGVL
ncbi:hypothetical protein [Acinetobacter sp. Ac_5812]|uniref:hypothetical protein n=1 Tax=Acinetobacter sp. Ac_5812 TaxID=1848937 RepID=UPI0014903B69|nr:hypothetical protein [Acinetobacter sp. Ac_5812]